MRGGSASCKGPHGRTREFADGRRKPSWNVCLCSSKGPTLASLQALKFHWKGIWWICSQRLVPSATEEIGKAFCTSWLSDDFSLKSPWEPGQSSGVEQVPRLRKALDPSPAPPKTKTTVTTKSVAFAYFCGHSTFFFLHCCCSLTSNSLEGTAQPLLLSQLLQPQLTSEAAHFSLAHLTRTCLSYTNQKSSFVNFHFYFCYS